VDPFFLVLIMGILTVTSNDVLGVETDEQEASLDKSDHRLGKTRAEVENLALQGPFVAAGASSGIEIATAVAIGVVGAALISYGEEEAQRGKSPTSKKPQDSVFASTGSNVRSTATTTTAGTSTTIGIATTVSTTSTTTASAGTSSASAISSTGSM